MLPLETQLVRHHAAEQLLNSLLQQYQYLGYQQPVGEHLKYLAKARGQGVPESGLLIQGSLAEAVQILQERGGVK